MEEEEFEVEDAEVVHDSGKALKIDAPIFDNFVWVPKSVITENSEVWKEGQPPGSLMVKYWWAEKTGWTG